MLSLKKILPPTILLIASLCSNAQPQDENGLNKIQQTPIFSIISVPDSTAFTNDQLPKGKPLVLIFFNPDCEHCQKETPLIKQVYEKWKPKGFFDVFAIATETDDAKWKNYIAKEKLTFTNVFDPTYESKYYLKYHIDITPELYLLNKDRKIIAMNIDAAQLDQLLTEEFSKK